MFETSHVATRVAVQRHYALLTASLTIHTAVVVAFLLGPLGVLTFPKNPPNELPSYIEPIKVTVPPPLGRRAAPQPVAAAQQAAQPAPPHGSVAPDRIPDAVQPFTATPVAVDPNAGPGDGTGSDAIGDPDGVIGGIDLSTPVATPRNDEPDRVYRAVGEVKPASVLHRVDPHYPMAALAGRISGVVVLECIIDKEGRVRDAQVVRSSFAIFNRPALDALQQWTFTPGMLHGRPVDTWFELTVAFQPK